MKKTLEEHQQKYQKYFKKNYSSTYKLLQEFKEDKNDIEDFPLLDFLISWVKDDKPIYESIDESVIIDKNLNIDKLYNKIIHIGSDTFYLKQKFQFYRNNCYEEGAAQGVFVRTYNLRSENGNPIIEFLFVKDDETSIMSTLEVKKDLTLSEYYKDLDLYMEPLTVEDIEDIKIAEAEALTTLNKIFD